MTCLNRRAALVAGAAAALVPGWAAAAGRPARGVLSNPRASAGARALYAYLWSIYGRRTLTGQQEQNFSPAGPRTELDYIQRVTGKQPALVGFDYIEPRDEAGVNARAIAWHRSGGIVTLCWHWGAPDIGTGYDNSKKDFDVARALAPGTPQNRAMMAQMAHTAALLTKLRDAGVPVLWRPFHEFSGDWFWWGKHGPEAFKALWRLMYRNYVDRYRLNNLIWVLGWAGQKVDPAYWPGRDMVDIAGADLYAEDHGNLAPMFGQVKAIVGESIPICLHENGPIPDPATLGRDADWLYFMTWHTRWLTDPSQNMPEQLKADYASTRYLTKDELPAFN
ncbi:glycoside hydrolase family 26 protein [Sphingomonas sp. R1]|uniref:glycoside hydrolase family 26 protein n=1 Tax=Sphingomonas sp. R1 TaxID=399176 RepID=UPI002224A04D|nr:glycoside hydrolase family 26 protein [Sphingomonas sp. R1]UYY77093.1 glycoside hydrolase family 26 protein [Sphingomonas sp. R1]